MSSEKQLREIAATAIREHLQDEPLNAIFEDVCCEQSLDPEHPDAERIRDLIHDWPILDLPVKSSSGVWESESVDAITHFTDGKVCLEWGHQGDILELTRAEALELASLLTAAALEEA